MVLGKLPVPGRPTTLIRVGQGRGDQIFFSATCPGQVACKNPLVLRNFLLVPKYFSNRKSIGQVANTTISLPLNQSCR